MKGKSVAKGPCWTQGTLGTAPKLLYLRVKGGELVLLVKLCIGILLCFNLAYAEAPICQEIFYHPIAMNSASPLLDMLKPHQIKSLRRSVENLNRISQEEGQIDPVDAERIITLYYQMRSNRILTISQMLRGKYPQAYRELAKMEADSAEFANQLSLAIGLPPLAVRSGNSRSFGIWLGLETAFQLVWLHFNPLPSLPGAIPSLIWPNAPVDKLMGFNKRTAEVGFDQAYAEFDKKLGGGRKISLGYRTLQNAIVIASIAFGLWALDEKWKMAHRKPPTFKEIDSSFDQNREFLQGFGESIIKGQIAKVEAEIAAKPTEQRLAILRVRLAGLHQNLDRVEHPEKYMSSTEN